MKAIRFAKYGGSEVLHVVEIDEPGVRAGQIRIAVRASGVNGFERELLQGSYGTNRRRRCPRGSAGMPPTSSPRWVTA